MATNKAMDSSDTLHTNIRVKLEPGTSGASTSSMPSIPLAQRVSSIKVEPGLPAATQRLTSYKLPRDLTLSGNIKTEKPKKIYTPNLNVQRNKKKDEPTSIKVETVRSRDNDRGRGRGRSDRGRGRGNRGNIVQSLGVWSEGVGSEPTASRKSNSSKASITNVRKYTEKPKLNTNKIVNKSEEEKKIKNLLDDDFTDDDEDDIEKMEPLLLPRNKKDIISGKGIKKKPDILEEAIHIKKEQEDLNKEDENKIPTIPQLIENKTNSYMLIQFPENLPGLERSSKEESETKTSNVSDANSESNNKAKPERYNLNSLKSGFLGKLEILKSGRTRLRLGETTFFVDVGAQQCFQQDLLAVKVDTGNLINLGPVTNKLLCSPMLGSMLENSNINI